MTGFCAQTRESTSINAIVKAELFPTNVRALDVGLPYAIAVSVFEGIAPAFKSAGHGQRFYYYFSAMIFPIAPDLLDHGRHQA